MNFKELAECLRPQHNVEANLKNTFTNDCVSKKYYPFDEGDTYYTVEKIISDAEYNLLVSNGENPERYMVVESTWDFVSEEIYDENPEQKYFITHKSANEWLNLNTNK